MNGSAVALASSNAFLGATVGAGVNQALISMPRWFESPPESLALARDRKAAALFIPLQFGSLAGLVSALVLNRSEPGLRRLVTAALGLYAATWISTAAYFAPEIMRLSRENSGIPPAEITRRGKRWLALPRGRHAALAGPWALTLVALGRTRSGRGFRFW